MIHNRFAVVGQGYVGLPLAIAAAEAGIDTVGIDQDAQKVKILAGGQSLISDIESDRIAQLISDKKYSATTSFGEVSTAEFIAVCVPTPIDDDRKPDLTYLNSALRSIGENMSDGVVVIIESTISPGMTREIALPILTESSGGKRFDLVYSPERIDPANVNWNVSNTPKLIAGLDENSSDRAVTFYSQFIKSLIRVSSVESVETAKLLENTFRLINISFINEFAIFCEKMGLDVREVIDAAATKPYGYMKFLPSAGIGGHCIPVDPAYLLSKANEIGAPSGFIEMALNFNSQLGERFASRAEELLGGVSGKTVLLVGVAYKPNVSDVRETPALSLREALLSRGARVVWHDHKVETWCGETSSSLDSVVDLLILVNPHSEVNLMELSQSALARGIPVLDTGGSTASHH